MLRFLLLRQAPGRHKTLRQALRDARDLARHGSARRLGRLGLLLRDVPRELLTRTTPVARLVVGGLLLVLAAAVVVLAAWATHLERRLSDEGRRLRRIEQTLADGAAPEDPELKARFEELARDLSRRVGVLEALSDAGRRVVRNAEGSVVFLQGGYTWTGPDDRPLRVVLGPDGRPVRDPSGGPVTSLDGDGPLVEIQFTGSAFLAGDDDLLVTNRHVAIPWSADRAAAAMVERGFEPHIRLLVYVPGVVESFEATLAAASENWDLAVLRAPGVSDVAHPLPVARVAPDVGDEVLVLGYPAGLDALLARSGRVFVDSVLRARPDFWRVARQLSEAQLIQPLASRGIVSQVTPASVVYDAETTRGGSGGPVLSLEGEVVAVTFAVMEQFGGSNLGVPASEVLLLLAEAGSTADAGSAVPRDAPVVAAAGTRNGLRASRPGSSSRSSPDRR
jgi:S1-C subfamily serine protease